MPHNHIVAPIALDLGASKTGVYSCIYPAYTDITSLSDHGYRTAFVANIVKNGYTLLQTDRTATRHAIRNKTRNKQAKKLLFLILDVVYQFPVYKHREAISHFMNRRGFTYIENQVRLDQLDELAPDFLTEMSQMLHSKGQESIADLFESMNPSDALNEMVCHHASIIQSILEHLSKWSSADNTRKKQAKPLLQALEFYVKDLTAGAQFRAKYFRAVEKDIKLLGRHPIKSCRKLFFALCDNGKRHDMDMVNLFYRLLCHINNFDLKLLNAIHRKIGDKSDAATIEQIISRHFGKWICKQWALSKSNGKARLATIRQLQQSWRQFESKSPDKIFDFFIQTPPEHTIPPYESHTNRRPPRCQTLTLNPVELTNSYPDWLNWLSQLTTPEMVKIQHQHYRAQLTEVMSSNGNPLIDDSELAARQLQLLLDANKELDPFKFNDIWSQLKKRRELSRKGENTKKTDATLKALLTQTELPVELHPDFRADPQPKSFWHLVNRYYQIRRKARAGRYFLHYDRQLPESKRWQNAGKLMMICRHRPRQLTHQAITDVCTLLGIGLQQLPLSNEEMKPFFQAIKGLKTASEAAYRAQKRHGADLKSLLHTEPDLQKINSKVPVLIQQLADALKLSPERKTTFINRNQSFFIMAQLYPLVWGDRSGFGKTCPVCAKDNSVRMADLNCQPQASRLSTLSMRLIDGALKRLLTHQAHHIANAIWPDILANSSNASQVTIPLILEQNRFDFTDNLRDLKGLSPTKKARPNINLVGKKQDRIQMASKGLCPYLDTPLTEDSGDIDHIIPRSGRYGVLNDEANLIYASVIGNRKIKKNRELALTDLNPAYLEAQFGTSNVEAITRTIEGRLWAKDQQAFVFGRYRQFIALDEPTQVAFRHALFLTPKHPLRAMVIDAIRHCQKARVNGTQRYMAQLLADILIAKSKGSALEGKLNFDYVEVSSNGLDEDSTIALRRRFRAATVRPELEISQFDKQPRKPQQDYSHVIDASMAFILALDKHQGEGALKLSLPQGQTIWGEVDDDGVFTANVYEQLAVEPEHLAKTVVVAPRANSESIKRLAQGAKPHELISRPVFSKNAIGLEFFDLCVIEGTLYKGFVDYRDGEAVFVKDKDKPAYRNLDMINFALVKDYYRFRQHGTLQVYHPNTQQLTQLLFDTLNKAKDRADFSTNTDLVKLALWLFGKGGAGQLFYYTRNTSLEWAPKIVEKQPASPYFQQWKRHYDKWLEIAPNTKVDNGRWVISPALTQQWHQHCRSVLAVPDNERAHKPVKTYSMKAITTSNGVVSLIRRNIASGKQIYQLYAIDNSTLGPDESSVFALSSPNVVLFNKERVTKGYPQTLKEKKEFKEQTISSSEFFDCAQCQVVGLKQEGLEVFVTKATQVEVRNVPISWFEDTLVTQGHDGGKRWKDMKTMILSNQADADDTLKQTLLQSILQRACKSDKRVGIQVNGEQLTLVLPYRSDSLAKLLSK